jgi:hypothetical protein
LPKSSNFTVPVTFANRVKSLPMPTFTPGWILVPTCRTKILPALPAHRRTFWCQTAGRRCHVRCVNFHLLSYEP